jgi:hypothetical protein
MDIDLSVREHRLATTVDQAIRVIRTDVGVQVLPATHEFEESLMRKSLSDNFRQSVHTA